MKVKALWGFVGQAGQVRRGQEVDVDAEYGHTLIGKGLAEEVGPKKSAVSPKETKPATAAETK